MCPRISSVSGVSLLLALLVCARDAAAAPPLTRIERFATRASLVAMAQTTRGLLYATLHDKPLGTTLWRWVPGRARPEAVDELAGSGFRVREGEPIYLRQTPAGPRLASLDPTSSAPRELATTGFVPVALRYAFPDGNTFLLHGHPATPTATGIEPVDGLFVYTHHAQSAAPLPVPAGCVAGAVPAVMGPTQAVVACGTRLFLATFAGAMQLTSDLDVDLAATAPMASPVPLDPGWDGYAGPILPLERTGGGPPFRLLRLGPPRLPLPPDGEIGAVFHRPDEDLLIVQQVRKEQAHRDFLCRPFAGRVSSMPAVGVMTGTVAHWTARELALWREGTSLVVADTRHLRPIARVELPGDPRPVPGSWQGERLLLATGGEASTDLLWFDLDGAAPRFQTAATALAGHPIAAFSAPAQKGCDLVMTRPDGPGLDLLRLEAP